MGGFFSSLTNFNPAGAGKPLGFPVIAVGSKAAWDERLEDSRRNASVLMVVDFTASWCGPCREMGPAFRDMACRFPDAVFVTVDVDQLPEVAKAYRVEAIPTFVLVLGGKEVDRVVGAKKELQNTIQQHYSPKS